MLLPLLWAQPALGFALIDAGQSTSVRLSFPHCGKHKQNQATNLAATCNLQLAMAQGHFNLAIEGYLSKQCTGNCFSSSFRCLCTILHRMLWRPFPTSMNLLQRFSASASIFAWLLVARILLFNSKIYTSSSEAIR